MPQHENVSKLYSSLQENGFTGLGTKENFSTTLEQPEKRKQLYDALVGDGFTGLGDFDNFEKGLGVKKKTQSELATAIPSPLESDLGAGTSVLEGGELGQPEAVLQEPVEPTRNPYEYQWDDTISNDRATIPIPEATAPVPEESKASFPPIEKFMNEALEEAQAEHTAVSQVIPEQQPEQEPFPTPPPIAQLEPSGEPITDEQRKLKASQQEEKEFTDTPSLFWGTVKAVNQGTASFFTTLDNAATTIEDITGMKRGGGFGDIAGHIEKMAEKYPDAPNTTLGNALTDIGHLEGLFLELAITPAFKSARLAQATGGLVIGVPKITTQLAVSGGVNTFGELTKHNPEKLNKYLETFKSMGYGGAQGTALAILGYGSGVASQAVKKATDSGAAAWLSGMGVNAGGFAGLTAAEQIITTGNIDPEAVRRSFFMGVGLAAPGLPNALFGRAFGNYAYSSGKAQEVAKGMKETPEEIREKTVDLREKAQEAEGDKKEELFMAADVLDNLADIKVMSKDVANNPQKYLDAIEADPTVSPEKKEFYRNVINDTVIKGDPQLKEAKKIENDIEELNKEKQTLEENTLIGESVKKAKRGLIDERIRDKEEDIRKIFEPKEEDAPPKQEVPPTETELKAEEVSGDLPPPKEAKGEWYHGTTTGKLDFSQESKGNQLPYGVHFTQNKSIAQDFATGATKGKATGKEGDVVSAKISATNIFDASKGVYFEGSKEYDILNKIAEREGLTNYSHPSDKSGRFTTEEHRKPEDVNAIDPSHVLDNVSMSSVKEVLKENGYDAAIKYAMRSSKDPLGTTVVHTEAIAVLDKSLVEHLPPTKDLLEGRSEETKQFVSDVVALGKKGTETIMGIGMNKKVVEQAIRNIEEGKETEASKKFIDTMEGFVEQGYAEITIGKGIESTSHQIPLNDFAGREKKVEATVEESKADIPPAEGKLPSMPKELLGETTRSATGFGGVREHTTGKTNLEDLKVLDNGIETAEKTLKEDKSFKPSKEPIIVGVDVNTGEKQLLDGYHRYLAKEGKGEVDAKFIPMRDGDIISFGEISKKQDLPPKPETKTEQDAIQVREAELAEEAKKYQSAEEFVKSQGAPVYHGTQGKFEEFDISRAGKATDSGMFGEGFYFTNNLKEAQTYTRGKGEVKQVYLTMKNPYTINKKSDIPKIETPDTTIKDLSNAPVNYSRAFTKHLQEQGYDGVIDNLSVYKQYVVFDAKNIKTKSQLTEIWNKTKAPKKDTPPPKALESGIRDIIADIKSGKTTPKESGIAAKLNEIKETDTFLHQKLIEEYKPVSEEFFSKQKELEKEGEADINEERKRAADEKIADGIDDLASVLGVKKSITEEQRPQVIEALKKIADGLAEKLQIKGEELIKALKEAVDTKFHKFIDENKADITKEDVVEKESAKEEAKKEELSESEKKDLEQADKDLNIEGKTDESPAKLDKKDIKKRVSAKKKIIETENKKDTKNAVRDMIFNRRVEISTGVFETKLFIEAINEKTTKAQRELIPFLIERTKVPKELEREDLEALQVTDSKALEPVVKEVREHFDNIWKKIVENTDKLSTEQIKDYVTHIWDIPKNKKAEVASWFSTKNKFLNKRFIDTLELGIKEFGLKPKTLDISEIIRIHASVSNNVIANGKFLKDIKRLERDGMKMMIRADKAPADWELIDHPALTTKMLISGAEGKPDMVVSVPIKVHPDLKKPLLVVFDKTIDNPVINAYESITGIMKKLQLSISLFHHGALTETAIPLMGLQKTLRVVGKDVIYEGLRREGKTPAFKNPELTKEAIKAGLQIGATVDIPVAKIQEGLQKFSKNMEGIPGAEQFAKITETFNEKWDSALWDYLHDGLKLYAYESMAGKMPKDVNPDKYKQEVAQLVNDTFGGQNWDVLMTNPKSLQIMRWALLSPDWTISTIRQALSPTGIGRVHKETVGVRRKAGAMFWLKAAQ